MQIGDTTQSRVAVKGDKVSKIPGRPGTGGASIYGNKFEDENFKYKHDKPGVRSFLLLSFDNWNPIIETT